MLLFLSVTLQSSLYSSAEKFQVVSLFFVGTIRSRPLAMQDYPYFEDNRVSGHPGAVAPFRILKSFLC